MTLLENVRKTPISIQGIVIGSAMLMNSAGILSLAEALLLIIASAETLYVGIDYMSSGLE